MNIFQSYKRTRLFLWLNIIGLAIGLAVSIMLILFVVNELSYDKHFVNHERIVRLHTVIEDKGDVKYYPINLRTAYTQLPKNVPGIEASTQIYKAWEIELIYEKEHFQKLEMLYVDPSFFDIFQMKFAEGNAKTALEAPHTITITRPYAETIFGNTQNAIGKTVSIDDNEFTVTAVVEPLPVNTHFSFDVLTNTSSFPWIEWMTGLEFFTYYLIDDVSPVQDVRNAIEQEYTHMVEPFSEQLNAKIYGYTEKLTDLYLHSKSVFNLGKSNDMASVWILIVLAIVILALAITNFLNLFVPQGETRMNEIGIRKANGARVEDIVKLFFSEVSVIVMISFVVGFILAVLITPYFSQLIVKEVSLSQLMNPVFIICIVLLFVFTVTLTAAYPSFYLSRFSPVDILGKHISFSKRRLTSVVVIFQSIITIVLISYILVINRQTTYLENIPKGYSSENVINFMLNKKGMDNYPAIKQELLKTPGIENVSGGQHVIGLGYSGQAIALFEEKENRHTINEYRMLPGFAELMNLQLIEGEFFKEESLNKPQLILNEAAVKMLGLESPVAGKVVDYKGPTEIIGVMKNFIYEEPANEIAPLVLFNNTYVSPNVLVVKYNKNISRPKAEEITLQVLHEFDPEFVINPLWSDDIYAEKFDGLKTQSKIISIGSLLSLLIAMMGLLAVHLYSTIRRTKEIGIRRVNGASRKSIFTLLSLNIIKWIAIAGVIAIPAGYFLASNWLNNFANHVSLNVFIFLLPVMVQCIIAIIVTSGVTMKVLSQNPVEAIEN